MVLLEKVRLNHKRNEASNVLSHAHGLRQKEKLCQCVLILSLYSLCTCLSGQSLGKR